MIGLPGAGKDTWIKANLPGIKCIACRDDVRIEVGLCGPGGEILRYPGGRKPRYGYIQHEIATVCPFRGRHCNQQHEHQEVATQTIQETTQELQCQLGLRRHQGSFHRR